MIAFLGIMSFFAFIIFGILFIVSLFRRKKGSRKRNILITGISFLLLVFFMVIDPNDLEIEDNSKNEEAEQEKKDKAEQEKKDKAEQEKKDKAEQEKKDKAEQEKKDKAEQEKKDKAEQEKKDKAKQEKKDTAEIEKRDFVVGKSDKNHDDIKMKKPSKMRNDVTDNWTITTMSENVDVNEYIRSYANEYMTEKGNLLYIINFNYKTTTSVNDHGLYYSVQSYEYVEGEEHDANDIAKGMRLGEWNIYKDNGDIVDFEKMVEADEQNN